MLRLPNTSLGIAIAAGLSLAAQAVPAQVHDLYPVAGRPVTVSAEGAAAFHRLRDSCAAVGAYEAPCPDETYEYWSPLDGGCSYYCGFLRNDFSATSTLAPQGNISYAPANVHDLDYRTAWIEGADGPGVGEAIAYTFPAETPRITDLIVVNGYAKSEAAWRANGRVRTLRLTVNDTLKALLHLEDTRDEQRFHVPTLGYADRDDYETLAKRPPWWLRLEIVEVYPGDEYEDTALTEVYFDGIDVH